MYANLLIVGELLKLHKNLSEYIIRETKKATKFLDSIMYLENMDEVENMINFLLNKKDNLVIASTPIEFDKISKIIGLMMNINELKIREDTLMPLKTEIYNKGGYVVNINDKLINVIKIEEDEKIPEVLLNPKKVDATLNIFGIDKDSIEIILKPIADETEATIYSFKFIESWAKVSVRARNFGRISKFVDLTKDYLPNRVIVTDNMIKHLIERYTEYGRKIAFAESCTGGKLAQMFTKESGVSEIYDGSIVTYSDMIKHSWLSVKPEILETFGAVSEFTVKQMLSGILEISQADYVVAISGIAGPNGGTKEKPIGTVFIGVRNNIKNEQLINKLIFNGDREHIQTQACYYAILMLIEMTKDEVF